MKFPRLEIAGPFPMRSFGFKRYWSGRLWYFSCGRHSLVLDWRGNFIDEMLTEAERESFRQHNK